MKTLLRANILNGYRSHRPVGFYSALRGHTGTDLQFTFEDFPSPVTGQIIAIHAGATKQHEMGNVVFLKDLLGVVHVFAHLDKIYKNLGDQVVRNDVFAMSGNTGSKTTAPHLHYEILTFKPINLIDKIMYRPELANVFKGYNTDPMLYLKNLYFKYHIDLDGKQLVTP